MSIFLAERGSLNPPSKYICFICKEVGIHWIFHCPHKPPPYQHCQANKSKSKQLVCGFVRECQKLFSLSTYSLFHIVPNSISSYILSYYFEHDIIDQSNMGNLMILKNNNCVTIAQDKTEKYGMYFSSSTAFFKRTVSHGIHKWKFQIININQKKNTWYCSLGIRKVETIDKTTKNHHFTTGYCNAYGFAYDAGVLINYEYGHETYGCGEYCQGTAELKKDDIIEMIVDFNKLELKFKINDIDYGKAFDIEQDIYKAAIHLCLPDDCIKFISSCSELKDNSNHKHIINKIDRTYIQECTGNESKCRYLVDGFLREYYLLFHVNDVILSYYFEHDNFDINNMGKYMTLTDDYRLRMKYESINNAFFMRSVSHGIHKWKFEIVDVDIYNPDPAENWQCSLGICNVNDITKDLKNDGIFEELFSSYAFYYQSGWLTGKNNKDDSYDDHWAGEYDIIEMVVNFNKLELKYIINGTDCGKAFDIEPGCYKAAIGLMVPLDCIRFVSSEQC